jgi:hypothetical protein
MTSFFVLDNGARYTSWYASLFILAVAIGQNHQWAEPRKCQFVGLRSVSYTERTAVYAETANLKQMLYWISV